MAFLDRKKMETTMKREYFDLCRILPHRINLLINIELHSYFPKASRGVEGYQTSLKVTNDTHVYAKHH